MRYAAAYLRVSDDRQDEYSPDSQLKLIREYANKNGYIVPDEYVFYDDGISGRTAKKRPAFNNMIAHAKAKEHPFDAIIVWKFSRFARNQEESIVFKSMLKKINVSVISVSETIDDSPFAPLIERIIEFMDEYYSTRLSQEVTRGMTEKASRGEAMCRGAFGYTLDGKTYVPNADADTVRWIFNSYLNGSGFRKIAGELNLKGVKTYRGNPPDNRFVEYILTNPVYIGKIRWTPEGRASSQRYKGDNSNVMLIDGKHEPIIDIETFENVQKLILDTKKRYGRYQRSEQSVEWMLKGLVRCSACGSTLIRVSLKDPAMQCHSYARGSCKVSHHLSIKKANDIVIKALEQVVQDCSFNIAIKEGNKAEAIDYEQLIKKEYEKIKRASQAYDAGFDTLEEYGVKKRAYQNKIAEYQEAQAKAKKELEPFDTKLYAQKVIKVLDFIKDSSNSEAAKNEALRTIIDHITYEKERQNLALYFYT